MDEEGRCEQVFNLLRAQQVSTAVPRTWNGAVLTAYKEDVDWATTRQSICEDVPIYFPHPSDGERWLAADPEVRATFIQMEIMALRAPAQAHVLRMVHSVLELGWRLQESGFDQHSAVTWDNAVHSFSDLTSALEDDLLASAPPSPASNTPQTTSADPVAFVGATGPLSLFVNAEEQARLSSPAPMEQD